MITLQRRHQWPFRATSLALKSRILRRVKVSRVLHVSRSTSETTFDIIYRIIPDGRKTPLMAELQPGAAVRFGGRFGTPVEEGISPECNHVIGVATGAGLGPLVGYAERALAAADGPERVDLFCGFRDLQDVCGGAAVEALKQQYPDRFSFMPCISKPMACTAVGLAGLSSSPSSAFSGMSSPPPPAPGFAQGRVSTAVPGMLADLNDRTHFHLIGNGQFVVDFQAGLLAGGVAEERVTTEKYFNGKATPDETVVDYVAGAISVPAAGGVNIGGSHEALWMASHITAGRSSSQLDAVWEIRAVNCCAEPRSVPMFSTAGIILYKN